MSAIIKHMQFLVYVKNYVTENPDAAAYVTDFVAHGIEQSRQEALERAADMEVALVAALSKRGNWSTGLLIDKLSKWNGRCSTKWDSILERLQEQVKK